MPTIKELIETGRITEDESGRNYKRMIIVRYDSEEGMPPTEDDVLSDLGIVQYSKHPRVNAFCTDVQADSIKDSHWWDWMVEASYGPRTGTSSDGAYEASTDPRKQPAELSWDTETFTKVLTLAYADEAQPQDSNVRQGEPLIPILNSLGLPFSTAVTDEVSQQVIVVDINVAEDDFAPTDLFSYRDTLNQKEVSVAGVTIPVRHGWMRKIGATRKYDNEGKVYFTLHFEIYVGETEYLIEVLNLSFYAILSRSEGQAVRILESDVSPDSDSDEPVQEPQLINNETHDLIFQPDPNADDIFMKFQVHYAKDWEPLPLPNTPTDERGD